MYNVRKVTDDLFWVGGKMIQQVQNLMFHVRCDSTAAFAPKDFLYLCFLSGSGFLPALFLGALVDGRIDYL